MLNKMYHHIIKIQMELKLSPKVVNCGNGYRYTVLTLNKNESSDILVITENGFGKKTNSDEYKSLSGRYAKGSKTINSDRKTRNGSIVCAAVVSEGKEFLVLTQKGKMVRMSVEDFRSKGKTTIGSKIVGLDNGDKVQTLVVVDKEISKEDDD